MAKPSATNYPKAFRKEVSPVCLRQCQRETFWWFWSECPPLPIPNREVKPRIADDTARVRGKVGRRQSFLRGVPTGTPFFVPFCAVLGWIVFLRDGCRPAFPVPARKGGRLSENYFIPLRESCICKYAWVGIRIRESRFWVHGRAGGEGTRLGRVCSSWHGKWGLQGTAPVVWNLKICISSILTIPGSRRTMQMGFIVSTRRGGEEGIIMLCINTFP